MPQHREKLIFALVSFGELGNLLAEVLFDLPTHGHFAFEQPGFLLQMSDGASALVNIVQRGVAFGGNYVRVLGANFGQIISIEDAGKTVQRIPATKRESEPLVEVVPERFQAQRCVPLAFGPLQGDHLAEGAGETARAGLRSVANRGADDLLEECSVGIIVARYLRQCFAGIERQQTTVPSHFDEVKPAREQPFLDGFPMRLGRDQNRAFPGLQ